MPTKGISYNPRTTVKTHMLCLENKKVCGLNGKNSDKRIVRDEVKAVLRSKLVEGLSLRTKGKPSCSEAEISWYLSKNNQSPTDGLSNDS